MKNLKAVFTGYLQPTTSQAFATEQMDRREGNITATSGDVKIFIRAKPTTDAAAVKYTYPSNIKDGVLFEVPFNTTQEQTVLDLSDAINNEVANTSSPLYNLISAGDLGLGDSGIGIEAAPSHITLEITTISGIELSQTNEPFDMSTDDRYFELKSDVRSGSVSYLEVGDEVNYLNGRRVDAGEDPFVIEGKENILRARVIQITPGSDLNYTIYLEE